MSKTSDKGYFPGSTTTKHSEGLSAGELIERARVQAGITPAPSTHVTLLTAEAIALVEANETIAALRKRVEVLELALLRQLDEHDSGHSPCSCQELRAALAAAEREET